MTMYAPSVEETRCFQPSKNIKIHGGIEGNVMKKEDTVGCSSWIRKAGIFAKVAKISLGLRKFRNHRKNFAILAKLENLAILAKLENFARLAKFRYLAKFIVPSEISQFRYISYFSRC